METLFQLLRKKRRNTASRYCKSLIMETEYKKADKGRRKSSLAELSWDEGKRMVELAGLPEGLRV